MPSRPWVTPGGQVCFQVLSVRWGMSGMTQTRRQAQREAKNPLCVAQKGKRARLGLCALFALSAFFSSFALFSLIPRTACKLQAPFDPASCIVLQPDDADEVWEPCDLRGVLQFMTNAHTRSQPSSARHGNPIHATRDQTARTMPNECGGGPTAWPIRRGSPQQRRVASPSPQALASTSDRLVTALPEHLSPAVMQSRSPFQRGQNIQARPRSRSGAGLGCDWPSPAVA